eukprot:g5303.t1
MLAPKSGQLQKKKKKKGDAAFQLQPPAGSVNFATGKVVGPAVSSTQSQSEAAASAAELKAALRIGLEQAALQASVAAASPSRVNSSTTKTSRMKDISDSSYRSQQLTRSTCAETSMLSATLLTEASGDHFPGHSHSRGSAGFAPPEDTSYVESVRGLEPPLSKRPERPPPGLDDKRTSTSAPAAEIVAAGGAAPEVVAPDSPSAAGSEFAPRPAATRRRQRLAKTSFQRGFHEGAHAQAVAAHEIAAGYALKMHEARLRDTACKDAAALRERAELAALQEQFAFESGLPLSGGELLPYPYDGTPYGLRGPRRELNAANQKGGGYPLSTDHAFNSQHLAHFPGAGEGAPSLGYTDLLGGVAQGGTGSAPQHDLVAVYDYDRHHYPRPPIADAVNYGADHHGLSRPGGVLFGGADYTAGHHDHQLQVQQYNLAHQLAQSGGYTGKMMKMGRPLNKNTAGGKGKHGFGGKQLGMSYNPGTSTAAAAWSSKGGGGKETGPLTKGKRAPQLYSFHTGTSSSAASSSTSASLKVGIIEHKKPAPNANKLLAPGPPAGAGRAEGEAYGQLHQDVPAVQLDESDRIFKNRVTDERQLKRALDQKQLRAHLHKTSNSAETAPSPPPEEFVGGPGRGSSLTPSATGVELHEDLQDSGTSTGGFEEDQHRLGDSVAKISSGRAGRTALNHQRLQQMLMREPEKLNYTSYNCPTKLPGYLSKAKARRMNVEHQDTALTFVTPNKTGPAAAAAAAMLGSVGLTPRSCNGGSHTPSGKGSASATPGERACHPKTAVGAIQGGSEEGDYLLSSAGLAACSGAGSPPPPAPHHLSPDTQHDGSIAMATTSTTCMLDLEAKSCRFPTQSLLAKQLQRSVESLRFESNGETTTRRGRPLLEDSPGHSTTTPSSNQFFSLSPVAGAVSPPEVGDEDHGHEDAKDENGKQGSGIGNGITGRKYGRPGASRVAAVRLFGTTGPTLELPLPAEEAASSSRASDQLSAARNHNPGLFRHKAKQTRAGRLEGMKLKLGLSSADGASEDPLTERQPEHELASLCTNEARSSGPHGPASARTPACFVPLYDAIVSGVGGRSCAEDPLAAVGTEFAALLQKEAALQDEGGGEKDKEMKHNKHCIKGDADLEFRAQGLSSNWLRAVYDDVSKALRKMNRPDAYMRFYGSTVNGFSGLSCAGVFSPLSQGNKGEQQQNSAGDVDVSIMVPELRADEERTFFHLLKHNLLTLGENTEDLLYGTTTTPDVATSTTGDQQHQEQQPPPGRDSIASRPSTGSGRIVHHGLSYEWCFNELLMFTKVKVLRMTLFEGSRAQEVDVELTLNNHAGVQNSGILYQLSQLELCPAGNFHRLLDFPSDHPVGVVTMDSVWQEGDSFDDRFVGSVRTNEAAGFRHLQVDFEKFRLPDDVTSQHSLSQGSGGGCSISRTASTQQQETSFPDVEGNEEPEETAPTPTRVILQRSFSAYQNSSRSPYTFGALGATVKELVRGVGGIPSKDVFEHHKAISSYRLLLMLIVYLQKEGVFQKDKNFQEGFFAPEVLLSSRGGEEKAIRKELLQKALGEVNSGGNNNGEGGSSAHKQPVLRSLAFLHKAQAEQLFRREMERQMQKYAVGGSGGCGTRRLGHTTYVSTAGHDVHPTDQAPAATRVTAAMAMRVSRPAYLFQYLLRGFFQYYLSAFRQSRAAVFSTADPWAYNPELVYRQHEVLFFTKRFEAIVEALGEA